MSKKNDYWSGYIFEKTDVFLHPRQRHETEKKALNKCVGVKFCIYNVLLLHRYIPPPLISVPSTISKESFTHIKFVILQ